jgi:hypothetical protein
MRTFITPQTKEICEGAEGEYCGGEGEGEGKGEWGETNLVAQADGFPAGG